MQIDTTQPQKRNVFTKQPGIAMQMTDNSPSETESENLNQSQDYSPEYISSSDQEQDKQSEESVVVCICNGQVDDVNSIQCEDTKCNKWFHASCLGIRKREYKILQKSKKPWYCHQCKHQNNQDRVLSKQTNVLQTRQIENQPLANLKSKSILVRSQQDKSTNLQQEKKSVRFQVSTQNKENKSILAQMQLPSMSVLAKHMMPQNNEQRFNPLQVTPHFRMNKQLNQNLENQKPQASNQVPSLQKQYTNMTTMLNNPTANSPIMQFRSRLKPFIEDIQNTQTEQPGAKNQQVRAPITSIPKKKAVSDLDMFRTFKKKTTTTSEDASIAPPLHKSDDRREERIIDIAQSQIIEKESLPATDKITDKIFNLHFQKNLQPSNQNDDLRSVLDSEVQQTSSNQDQKLAKESEQVQINEESQEEDQDDSPTVTRKRRVNSPKQNEILEQANQPESVPIVMNRQKPSQSIGQSDFTSDVSAATSNVNPDHKFQKELVDLDSNIKSMEKMIQMEREKYNNLLQAITIQEQEHQTLSLIQAEAARRLISDQQSQSNNSSQQKRDKKQPKEFLIDDDIEIISIDSDDQSQKISIRLMSPINCVQSSPNDSKSPSGKKRRGRPSLKSCQSVCSSAASYVTPSMSTQPFTITQSSMNQSPYRGRGRPRKHTRKYIESQQNY